MTIELIIELSIRMFLALAVGFAIGFERKMRFKEAGIRTHTIVCVGACLYMIISQYGFKGADTSRVAAQIVSGIGFIGAGMIFYHKEMIHGLTTAAGIWATAAIGMAAGAGMYVICIVASVIIILVQCIMHLNFKVFHSKHFVKVNVIYKDDGNVTSAQIKEIFGVERFSRISVKRDGEQITYNAVISTDKAISAEEMRQIITENPSILSLARQDDDF